MSPVSVAAALVSALVLTACSVESPDTGPRPNSAASPIVVETDEGEEAAGPEVETASRDTCLEYDEHEAVICAAYFYDSYTARLPYYKFGATNNRVFSLDAYDRLQKRYIGQALDSITNTVSHFPDEVNVDSPVIRITGITADLDRDTASLDTVETWLVRDKNGNVLYQEDGRSHEVQMQRVQGIVFQRWVVSQIN